MCGCSETITTFSLLNNIKKGLILTQEQSVAFRTGCCFYEILREE
jgi:hypothetical protein